MLKGTKKKQGFTLSLENTVLKKLHVVVRFGQSF